MENKPVIPTHLVGPEVSDGQETWTSLDQVSTPRKSVTGSVTGPHGVVTAAWRGEGDGQVCV